LEIGDEREVRSVDGRKSATIKIDALELLQRGRDRDVLAPLSSPWFGRLVDVVVNEAHDAYEREEPDFRRVTLTGGLDALRDRIGYQDSGNDNLRLGLTIGQNLRVNSPGVIGGGLWTWSATRGGPGTPGTVSLVLGDLLLPGFVNGIPKGGRSFQEARRVVPVLSTCPPYQSLEVNRQQYGRVYHAHRAFLVLYRDRVRPEDGKLVLRPEDLREIAAKVGLDASHGEALLRVWRDGDGERGPLLEVDDDTVWLTDDHELAREFMRQGAERAANGRRTGRTGARRRAKGGA